MIDWKPISETPPKDRRILGWHVEDCSDPRCAYSNPQSYRGGCQYVLCLFHGHAEGMSSAAPGPVVMEWGGAFDDSTWEYPNQASMPDWWFQADTEFEVAVNPTHWADINDPA